MYVEFKCKCLKAVTKLLDNAIIGLQCNLFTVEVEFINLFAVITFTRTIQGVISTQRKRFPLT